MIVNDIHSRLNRTVVRTIAHPRDPGELVATLKAIFAREESVAVCGHRHAMGGQQFARGATLIDLTAMTKVIGFDAQRGLIEIEAGADWPTVIRATHDAQPGEVKKWAIRQKQTGADALTLGGALAANVHGRGLLMRPIIDDVEAFTLVTADAQIVKCSREVNRELFSLVIGGYGLFGIIASVMLRLAPRMKLRRLVEVLDIDDAIPAARRRVAEGCVYGDFQYAIDPADDSFLRRGVCACYLPVSDATPLSDEAGDLAADDWTRLLRLAVTDKRRAFKEYSAHYLRSHGRVYWSDTMQLSTYLPTYSQLIDDPQQNPGDRSLVIGEQYVPPDELTNFLGRARAILRELNVEDIYGTIRTIQQDDESFLAWAKKDYACVIFNLLTPHDPAGIAHTHAAFRALNASAIECGGSFYLTYHRAAPREQVEAAYPQFEQFLQLKRAYDPLIRFTSDWYRHYAKCFA